MFGHNIFTRTWIFLSLIGIFLLLLDQALKFIARASPKQVYYLVRPWLGWEYFANPGIALSLPIPNSFLLIITPFILLALVILLARQKSPLPALGLILILGGAISNFLDRFLFGVTVDYIRVATGVFNLGDVMIVAGGLSLIVIKRPIDRTNT